MWKIGCKGVGVRHETKLRIRILYTVYRRHSKQIKPNSVSSQRRRLFCEINYIDIEYNLLVYGKRFFQDL